MNWICRILGHKLKSASGNGISPRDMKYVYRYIVYCERGDYRKQTDEPTGVFDIKNGINLWGSGGICLGCKLNQTCPSSCVIPFEHNGHTFYPNFSMEHCPINSFDPKDPDYLDRLSKWGDTLVS